MRERQRSAIALPTSRTPNGQRRNPVQSSPSAPTALASASASAVPSSASAPSTHRERGPAPGGKQRVHASRDRNHSERGRAGQQVITRGCPRLGRDEPVDGCVQRERRRRNREHEHVHPCRSEPPRAQRRGSAERPARASRRDHLLASKPDGQHAQLAPVFRSHERRPSRKSRICGVTNYASGSGSADLDRRHARMELPDEAPSGGRG